MFDEHKSECERRMFEWRRKRRRGGGVAGCCGWWKWNVHVQCSTNAPASPLSHFCVGWFIFFLLFFRFFFLLFACSFHFVHSSGRLSQCQRRRDVSRLTAVQKYAFAQPPSDQTAEQPDSGWGFRRWSCFIQGCRTGKLVNWAKLRRKLCRFISSVWLAPSSETCCPGCPSPKPFSSLTQMIIVYGILVASARIDNSPNLPVQLFFFGYFVSSGRDVSMSIVSGPGLLGFWFWLTPEKRNVFKFHFEHCRCGGMLLIIMWPIFYIVVVYGFHYKLWLAFSLAPVAFGCPCPSRDSVAINLIISKCSTASAPAHTHTHTT